MKPKLLLLCGGQSSEHEVSLASAHSVCEAAGENFEVTPLVIDKEGKLLSLPESQKALEQGRSESLSAGKSLNALPAQSFDIVFPLLHGPYGEDGTVQGLLKMLHIPFVGCGVLSSAVGMDKLMMKSVFAAHRLPQVPYRGVRRNEILGDIERVIAEMEVMGYPMFVKPANLGSSVGISKAKTPAELRWALQEASRYDRRIIIEKGYPVRELEVAILGNDQPQASVVGEITYQSDFYDYDTKYSEGKADLHIPANIPLELAKRCQALAIEAFQAIDGAGLARVDFFYDETTDSLYLNEINTMPGFTKTSMYPKLWQASGLGYSELIQKLATLALEKR